MLTIAGGIILALIILAIWPLLLGVVVLGVVYIFAPTPVRIVVFALTLFAFIARTRTKAPWHGPVPLMSAEEFMARARKKDRKKKPGSQLARLPRP